MMQYRLDYTIEKILEDQLSGEQKFIRQLTGKVVPNAEAKTIWQRIQEHKWYVSEKLRRDVGLQVASVDYMENIYPKINEKRANGGRLFTRALQSLIFTL